MALQRAFSAEYVIQDDARQFVFWMQRFKDPGLFPNDLIADFFQSVTPFGYTLFYRLFALVGVEPILLSKLLPLFLGLIITSYLFGISMQILPVPAAAWIVTLLFNQSLWKTDDLISATPRAFGYCLLIVFLYYLLGYETNNACEIKIGRSRREPLRGERFICLLIMALIGVFYPHYIFICVGLLIVRLFHWQNGSLRFSQNHQDYWFIGLCLGVFVLVMLPFALKVSDFGPTITATQAKALPQFLEGRTSFFDDNIWRFFIQGDRSGMLPKGLFTPATLGVGLLLPLLLRFPQKLPLFKSLTDNFKLLTQIVLVSLTMFFLAHALLFKLHLPSRYTHYPFRIVIALAAGIVLITLLDTILNWTIQLSRSKVFQKILVLGFISISGIAITLYPLSWKHFPNSNYIVGQHPELYKFFAEQPKDIMIASISDEASNLPIFSQRSILVSYEHTIPYQIGYYQKIQQRINDLILAQYTLNIDELKIFINTYKVDFIVMDSSAFTEEYLDVNPWFDEWKALTKSILLKIKQKKIPVLVNYLDQCLIFESNNLQVLKAQCIANS